MKHYHNAENVRKSHDHKEDVEPAVKPTAKAHVVTAPEPAPVKPSPAKVHAHKHESAVPITTVASTYDAGSTQSPGSATYDAGSTQQTGKT
jgi:hypothetical protein